MKLNGTPVLTPLTELQREGDRTIKGLNFFRRTEQRLLRAFASVTSHAAPWLDQTRRPYLSLAPHSTGPRRHRRRTLPEAI